jgi:hypothetical protein
MTAALLALLVGSGGCKKKPPATVPAQATPPAPTAPDVPAAPNPKPTELPKAEPASSPAPENTQPKPTAKPTHRAKPRSSQKLQQKVAETKEPPTAAPSQAPHSTEGAATAPAETSQPNEQIGNKIIVRDGSTSPPPGQISTTVPDSQETRTRHNTETLLEETEKNIRALNRVLNEDEQAMLAQVRTFMQQSKGATSDGDTMRANNLAQKAQLLSAELSRKK